MGIISHLRCVLLRKNVIGSQVHNVSKKALSSYSPYDCKTRPYLHYCTLESAPLRLSSRIRDPLGSIIGRRYESSATPSSSADGFLPDPPSLVPLPDDSFLTTVGEPTLSSLGLANYTPSGLVQMGLENLHIGLDLPWWGAIVVGTVIVRLAILPLAIIARRNMIEMANHMPTIQGLNSRISAARMEGDFMGAYNGSIELKEYMKRHAISPFKNMLVPFAQIPIFLSVYRGLSPMAELPVLSMKTGGMLWFMDLTIPDPYFLLPLLTSATLLAIIELGADAAKVNTMPTEVKWMMRIMPAGVFIVTLWFPSALLCYWLTSNLTSLLQVMIFKIAAVRIFLNIPEEIDHSRLQLKGKAKSKGFNEDFRESVRNMEMISKMIEKQKLEDLFEDRSGSSKKRISIPNAEDLTKGTKSSASGEGSKCPMGFGKESSEKEDSDSGPNRKSRSSIGEESNIKEEKNKRSENVLKTKDKIR